MAAVLDDLKWLKWPGSTFSSFCTDNLAEFMQLATTPVTAARSLQKACGSPEALTYALEALPIFPKVGIVMAENGPIVVEMQDAPTRLECDLCDYSCSTSKQMAMHSRIKHMSRHPVNRCIDVPWCTVCGIHRHNRAGMMVHLQDRSKICRLNLLLRGEFVTEEAAEILDAEAATSRLSNVHSGTGKHQVDKLCVRVFGPWQKVVVLEGMVICTPNGHPLGNSQKWYWPARLEPKHLLRIGCPSYCKHFTAWVRGQHTCRCAQCKSVPSAIRCPASKSVQCTEKCMVCGSSGLNATAPYPMADSFFSRGLLTYHIPRCRYLSEQFLCRRVVCVYVRSVWYDWIIDALNQCRNKKKYTVTQMSQNAACGGTNLAH